jgi:hypothetical protein
MFHGFLATIAASIVAAVPALAQFSPIEQELRLLGQERLAVLVIPEFRAAGGTDHLLGDREMLEWTGAGAGARLKMLVLHDDATREYAYGPAQGLPDSKVGTFTPGLFDEAKKKGWTVISMKNDWKRIFPFE